ncbi:hypothetical protein GJ496_010516 [Pomphorhynchus laevis]|nr:hypothetical protein GJ496_010516 [Pomphorhynchus laevis]
MCIIFNTVRFVQIVNQNAKRNHTNRSEVDDNDCDESRLLLQNACKQTFESLKKCEIDAIRSTKSYSLAKHILEIDGDKNRLKIDQFGKLSGKHTRWVRKLFRLHAQGKLQNEMDIIDSIKYRPRANNDIEIIDYFFKHLEKKGFQFQVIPVGDVNTRNEEALENSFQRFCNFLVKSNLININYGSRTGCFHELYRYNGRIIAVSVYDVLPEGLSSVYFFYDPEFSNLSLGTVSALRDILQIKQTRRSNRNFKFYHLGLFCYHNKKLAYKMAFKPCQLLCPYCHKWIDFDKCSNILKNDERIPICQSDDSTCHDDDSDHIDVEYIKGYVEKNEIFTVPKSVQAWDSVVDKCTLSLSNVETYIYHYLHKVGKCCGRYLIPRIVV